MILPPATLPPATPDLPPLPGRVYLVGGGPGDPGLLTLRGAECLARADIVLYDYLVSPAILRHAPAAAERICLGRHGHGRRLSQEEINGLMVDGAQRGATVVRLKGGDPTVFAHAHEELTALEQAKISYEIVPGVTAAIAVGGCAGVPLTDREHSSAIALVTGQEDADKAESTLDYAGLANFPGTLVFYMGVTTASKWTAALIAAGKSPDTPTLIVQRCSWPDQVTIPCRLADVPGEIAARSLRPPVLVVVGEVARLGRPFDWFSRRSLSGVRVLVTRPAQQADDLARPLAELGAEVLVQPAIEIAPPVDVAAVDRALAKLGDYDWLVFSSANGVRMLVHRLWANGGDLRRLSHIKLAAIGDATADELRSYHLRADIVPNEFRAEALAAELAAVAQGRRFLLARASRGREVLAEQLRAAGAATVDQVVVYESRDVTQLDPDIAAALTAGRIDWITVTSSAIARSLVHLFGQRLQQSRLVSISPVTTATLVELGYSPAAEATEYTTAGIVAAIVRCNSFERVAT